MNSANIQPVVHIEAICILAHSFICFHNRPLQFLVNPAQRPGNSVGLHVPHYKHAVVEFHTGD